MSCAPIRFLVGAGATAALAGLGYFMTGGYGGAAAEPTAPIEAAPIQTASTDTPATETPAAPEAPATAEQVASCQTQVDTTIKGQTIQFDTSTATIKAESQPLIDAMAGVLTPCAGTNIEVAGHTDLTGDAAANMTLSEERANAVVAALVAKGVPTARLQPKGYGETQPVRRGTSPAVHAANRRIEFKVNAVGSAPVAATATESATGQ